MGVGLLERFGKLFTNEFERTASLIVAEELLKSVEKVLDSMGVTNELRLTLTTFRKVRCRIGGNVLFKGSIIIIVRGLSILARGGVHSPTIE